MYFLLLCVAGIILLLIAGAKAWEYRFQIKRRIMGRRINAWLKLYNDLPRTNNEGGVLWSDLFSLPPCPRGWSGLPEAKDAVDHVQRARDAADKAAADQLEEERQESKREEHRQAQAKVVADFKLASSLANLESMAGLHNVAARVRDDYIRVDDLEWVKAALSQAVKDYVSSLMSKAQADDDRDSFVELHAFMTASEYQPGYRLYVGSDPLSDFTYRNMMVRYLADPCLTDYLIFKIPNYKTGVVSKMAGEALDKRSLVLAKLVLAYCKENFYRNDTGRGFHYRLEIGDVLYADLVKLVARLHARQGLFRPAPKANTTTT